MTTENKFILFSIFAIIIGVFSILPVGYFLTTTVQAETTDEPWFSVNIPYSYWEAKNGTFDEHEYPTTLSFNETEVESYGHGIILNYTLITDIENQEADARIEYFRIEFSSDKEVIDNEFAFIGTKRDISFDYGDFQFSREGWFDTSRMGGGGLLRHNWSTGESQLWPGGGGGTGTIREDSIVSKIRAAETVYVSLYRLGWITFSENSTAATLIDNKFVDRIQLDRYGEGWLYNNLLSEEDLANIDLWRPLDYVD
jgi:hypothetical protein